MNDTPETVAERVAAQVSAFHARLVADGVSGPVAVALTAEYLRWLLNRPTPTADTIKRSAA